MTDKEKTSIKKLIDANAGVLKELRAVLRNAERKSAKQPVAPKKTTTKVKAVKPKPAKKK
jgi:hypothetical protein